MKLSLLPITAILYLATNSLATHSRHGETNPHHLQTRALDELHPRGPVRTRSSTKHSAVSPHGTTTRDIKEVSPSGLRRTDDPPPASKQRGMSVRLHVANSGVQKRISAARVERPKVVNMPVSPFDTGLDSALKRGSTPGRSEVVGKDKAKGMDMGNSAGLGKAMSISPSRTDSGSSTARSPKHQQIPQMHGAATLLANQMGRLSTGEGSGS